MLKKLLLCTVLCLGFSKVVANTCDEELIEDLTKVIKSQYGVHDIVINHVEGDIDTIFNDTLNYSFEMDADNTPYNGRFSAAKNSQGQCEVSHRLYRMYRPYCDSNKIDGMSVLGHFGNACIVADIDHPRMFSSFFYAKDIVNEYRDCPNAEEQVNLKQYFNDEERSNYLGLERLDKTPVIVKFWLESEHYNLFAEVNKIHSCNYVTHVFNF